jgi:solute carrier family 25 S-adenosylmethionine transporter 26
LFEAAINGQANMMRTSNSNSSCSSSRNASWSVLHVTTSIAFVAVLVLGPSFSLGLQPPIIKKISNHHHQSTTQKSASATTTLTPFTQDISTPSVLNLQELQQQQLQLQQQQRNHPAIWKLAVAGALATLISDVTMHPVDCIKTLQQSEEGMGLSMMAAANVIYTQCNIQGFLRGFLTWGVCDSLGGALKFTTYEGLKRQLQHGIHNMNHDEVERDNDSDDGDTSSAAASAQGFHNAVLFALAGISFVASSVITVPGELLKQHLQMGHYPGCFEALWNIVETQGIAGLYTGYDGVLLRDVPYTSMELGLYDLFKTLYVVTLLRGSRRNDNDNSSISNIDWYQYDNYDKQEKQLENPQPAVELQTSEQIMIAALTGGIAGLLTCPLDAVKTRMMLDADYIGYSFWDATLLTIEEHGPEALFCGALARVAWLAPVTAIYLPAYDFIKNMIQQQQQEQKHAHLRHETQAIDSHSSSS